MIYKAEDAVIDVEGRSLVITTTAEELVEKIQEYWPVFIRNVKPM